jgi:hypothetical protein
MQFRPSKKQWLKPVVFVGAFAVIGIIMLFRSFALGTGTITGQTFNDLNRDGIFNGSDTALSDQRLYLYDANGAYMTNALSDAGGNYSFTNLADGDYTVQYAPASWWAIRNDWVPTTTNGSLQPQIPVSLHTAAMANFGWRKIVRSTDANNPVSSYKGANGLVAQSYDDAVSAETIFNSLMTGSLIGKEAQYVTVKFDFATTANTATLAVQSNGVYNEYHATSYITYESWLDSGDRQMFHEYGHAWSLYYTYITQQDPTLAGYLKVRGIYGDARLNTSYAWNSRELIAEDYRQLFGSANAQIGGQINPDLPLAKDVPGLKDYLSGAFITGTSSGTPPAPSAPLTATATLSTEGPAVQLSWGASAGAAGYEIYRNGTRLGSVNAPSTTYYDGNGLNYSTSYSYYIKPLSSTGTAGPASNTVTVTTPAPDTTKPTTPGSLTSPSQTQTSINLSWGAATDNVGVVGYRVYQVGGNKRNQFTTLLTTTTNTTYTVTGLNKGTSYSFYVTAIDAAGNESVPTRTLTVKTRR